jgi:hypothetical protein
MQGTYDQERAGRGSQQIFRDASQNQPLHPFPTMGRYGNQMSMTVLSGLFKDCFSHVCSDRDHRSEGTTAPVSGSCAQTITDRLQISLGFGVFSLSIVHHPHQADFTRSRCGKLAEHVESRFEGSFGAKRAI